MLGVVADAHAQGVEQAQRIEHEQGTEVAAGGADQVRAEPERRAFAGHQADHIQARGCVRRVVVPPDERTAVVGEVRINIPIDRHGG